MLKIYFVFGFVTIWKIDFKSAICGFKSIFIFFLLFSKSCSKSSVFQKNANVLFFHLIASRVLFAYKIIWINFTVNYIESVIFI